MNLKGSGQMLGLVCIRYCDCITGVCIDLVNVKFESGGEVMHSHRAESSTPCIASLPEALCEAPQRRLRAPVEVPR